VPPKQEDQLRGVLVEAARTQLAAVTAGIKFWAGWVESADKYTRAVDAELAKLDESGDQGDVVGRVSDLTREYLRNMTQLPSEDIGDVGDVHPERGREDVDIQGILEVEVDVHALAHPPPLRPGSAPRWPRRSNVVSVGRPN